MRRVLLFAVLSLWLVPAAWPTTAEQAQGGRGATAKPAPAPAAAPASSAMTNADVVKMVKAGLGEDLIISAIRGAAERKFTLGADGLVELKTDGVSDRIIAVMLNPSAPAAAPAPAPAPAPTPAPPPTGVFGGVPPPAPGSTVAEVSLVTSAGAQAISPESGDMSQSYAVIKMVVWANFRGLQSDVRVKERRPSVLVKVNDPKASTRFIVVKAEADDDDNVRSVRIKSGVYSATTAFVPDNGWVIASKISEESPGVWRMTLSKDLAVGEYGIFDVVNRYMYGFAVEK